MVSNKTIAFVKQFLIKSINSLWHSGDAIWWHKTGLKLAQVMACCLLTPSHYWTIAHSSSVTFTDISHSRAILREIPQSSSTKIQLKITYHKFHSNLPGINELKRLGSSNLSKRMINLFRAEFISANISGCWWLLSSPGHHQPWYWPSLPGVLVFQH